MNIKLLVKLTSRAWSLDILAHLVRGVPGRQAALLSASGASRNALAQSLAHLIDLGLIERNPGHGHPLRPEFRLTELGRKVGAAADQVKQITPKGPDFTVLRRSWTVPVLVISQEPRRFSDLRNALPPITDRALSQTLQQLQAVDWLHRQIDPDAPVVRPLYQAANAGRDIGQALALVI